MNKTPPVNIPASFRQYSFRATCPERKKTMKYICEICSWEYDEEKGCEEEGIAPGTPFANLPDIFKCPMCGVGKEDFHPEQ